MQVPAGQPGDGQLPDDDPVGAQSELVEQRRVQLADPPDDGAAGPDHGRPARVERRIVGQAACSPGAGMAEPGRQQLDDALGVIEVVRAVLAAPRGDLRGPGQGEREAPPLARRLIRTGARPVALADLEEGDVGPAVTQVRRDDLEQAARGRAGA